jgi:hypothetical protein
MATNVINNECFADEYKINEYKDSDYYDNRYYDNEYFRSIEYLEGLEELDDFVAFKTYDEEFDVCEPFVNRLDGKITGKNKKKNYAALPLSAQLQHFIKVERKQLMSERKRLETMYLFNKRAERAEHKLFSEEDIDYDTLGCTKETTITLIKDSYWARVEEEDRALLEKRAYYTMRANEYS